MAVDPFVVEAWTWLSVTLTLIIARYVSRFLQVKSIRRMGWEDLVMLFVAMLYIAEINFLVKIEFTPTNLIAPGETLDLNDSAQVALRVYGSKIIVAQEQNYCALIWCTKACLLLYYAKLTYALPGSFLWTKLTAVYVAVGYVVMTILYYTLWCRPFYAYWSVPVTDPQCATATNHLILNYALNVSSDLMILAIPLPLLLRTRLPPRKKLALVAAFSLGLFVIAAATLNRYYSFTQPTSNKWVYWFAREGSTAVIVANIPHLWALFRRAFQLPSFVGNSQASSILRTTPSRFYESVDNPLEGKRSPKTFDESSGSFDSYNIDLVLANAERECEQSPRQPLRFRDMEETSPTWNSTPNSRFREMEEGGVKWGSLKWGTDRSDDLAVPPPSATYLLNVPMPTSSLGLDFEK